ncbi:MULTISPECIES: hypothetical protein [Bacillus cereus group]|uniref:hypothetical protein n=1 Tax=Bacillus cereus group TaxID=86661 RepID=UPI0021D0CDCF|nr:MULTISPECIES: hypothetical protein [Bacillus cereus group]MCU5201631.1 hypothetical protein [Bacillus paranthracis]MCU5374711.1 hypothetical protein [Bacillus pacificus]
MNIEQKYGRLIWKEIKKNVLKYAQKKKAYNDITHLTRADELFYRKSKEGNNRYGQVLFDTFTAVNEMTGKELRIDYKPYTEFDEFPEMKDIWLYFINKLERLGDRKSEEEENVVPFTR